MIALAAGAIYSWWIWEPRDYGQLTAALMTVFGVVLTLWATRIRAIEQQERDDRKDRDQRSITQRINLAEKLVSAIDHLSSDNELQQAAGVQEILFQIDDWHALIKSEINGIEGKESEVKSRKNVLKEESLRRRQELFDIAYKFDTKNVELLKSRARGLKQRLVEDGDRSLIELDFSGMVIGWPRPVGEVNLRIDLEEISAKDFIMSNSEMRNVDLIYASLERVNLGGAHLERADLTGAHLEGANLSGTNLKGANLLGVHLEGANLKEACLEGANLPFAYLEGANLTGAHLEGANLSDTNLKGANLLGVHLEGANLKEAHLEGANLSDTNLKGANLLGVHLENADLRGAHLEKADLTGAHLQGANLGNVFFDQIALWNKKLLDHAEYDNETSFPKWLDPDEHGMQRVDGTEHES